MKAGQTAMNVAHRGASACAPENTFAAFDLAPRMGADALETDLRLTGDGAVVLMHDERVERTTDGSGRVGDLSLAAVRRLDAGSWYGPEFAGERVPTLGEFLDAYGGKVPLVLELKADAVAATLAPVRRRGLMPGTTFTAFDMDLLLGLLALESRARTGYLARVADPGLLGVLSRAGVAQVCPHASIVTPSLVRSAHDSGLEVRAWGVNDDETMRGLLDAGVDGMTVNWPDRLDDELRRRRNDA